MVDLPLPPGADGPGAIVPEGYSALRESAGWRDLAPRVSVAVVGEDAVRFIDGFCTAAVGALRPGEGSEAFFLDARGQVSAWGTVLRAADGVWIDADPSPTAPDGSAFCLRSHLDAYHIRERLRIVDASGTVATLLVAGPHAASWLAGAGVRFPEVSSNGHDVTRLAAIIEGEYPGRCAGSPAAVVRGEWAGAGSFLLLLPFADRDRVIDRLREDGVPEVTRAALDAVRREEGRPAPIDIPPRGLPQEFGRTRRAISFTKGCYLGQETVARIDALGHVNRRLVGVVVGGGAEPLAGAAVEAEDDGAVVGTITSAGPSPRFGAWLALALVRTAALRKDAAWRVAGAPARPVTLPQTEGWE
mgnify:CR=1 FL=1